jgi:hypothetical protein
MHFKAFFISMLLMILFEFPLNSAPAFAASTSHQLQVAAMILDRGHCSFVTPGPYLISFDPALDPFAPIERNASITFQVNCKGIGNKGSTIIVNRSGAEQLYLSKGTDLIPYNLDLPSSRAVQNNQPVDITLMATIAENSYRNASPGDYGDTITINVLP